jgi:hypothetical protein
MYHGLLGELGFNPFYPLDMLVKLWHLQEWSETKGVQCNFRHTATSEPLRLRDTSSRNLQGPCGIDPLRIICPPLMSSVFDLRIIFQEFCLWSAYHLPESSGTLWDRSSNNHLGFRQQRWSALKRAIRFWRKGIFSSLSYTAKSSNRLCGTHTCVWNPVWQVRPLK